MNDVDQAPEPLVKKTNWNARIAVLFLFVFATFWSLGPFFFWTPLLLSAYFGFLALYTSASIRESFSRFAASIGKQEQPSISNPYQAFRPRTATTEQTRLNPRVMIRLFIAGFVFLIFFITLISFFTSGDEGTTEQEVVSYSETPEEDATTYWTDRGNAALQNELPDSAHYYYNKALEIDPQNMYALYNKGLAYILRQEYLRGNTFARRCLRYHSDYDPAWWLLGYSYDLTNNTDSALYCLEQAYTHGYNHPDFVQLMAEVYVKKDRRAEALEVYKKLVELDTAKVDAWRKMAELDPVNAEYYLQKARALGN